MVMCELLFTHTSILPLPAVSRLYEDDDGGSDADAGGGEGGGAAMGDEPWGPYR